MRGRDEVPSRHLAVQKSSECGPVPLGWRRDPCHGAVEPFFYLLPGGAHRYRLSEDARAGRNPYKTQEARPRETDRRWAIQLSVEPVSGRAVLGHVCDAGVQ